MRILLLILLITSLLSGCGKTTEAPDPDEQEPSASNSAPRLTIEKQSVPRKNPAIETLPGYKRTQEIVERDNALAELSDLTAENLATQTRLASDGKKQLSSRRLILNYLKEQNASTPETFLKAFSRVRAFVGSQDVVLTEADIMVLIASLRIEKPSWDLCKDLEEPNTQIQQYPDLVYLQRVCGIPTSK